MKNTWYLFDHKTKEITTCNALEADKFLGSGKQVIKKTQMQNGRVSTVFLCLDYGFSESANPVLFETCVFNGPKDGFIERYETYEEAIEGHDKIVNMVEKNNSKIK